MHSGKGMQSSYLWVEGRATRREKGDEDSYRISYANSPGLPSLHGSGRVGREVMTEV